MRPAQDEDASGPNVAGLLLAAGAGRRMGSPKGLLRSADGTPWVARAAAALRDGGCGTVTVVVGAAAEQVTALVPEWAQVVEAADWQDGMSASLRTGLWALTAANSHSAADIGCECVPACASGPTGDSDLGSKADLRRAGGPGGGAVAALVMLVDTPGVGAAVVDRLVRHVGDTGANTLARAAYDGRPGHPVLLGRRHWAGVIEHARGDEGARGYLRGRSVTVVECADIGDGTDIDTL